MKKLIATFLFSLIVSLILYHYTNLSREASLPVLEIAPLEQMDETEAIEEVKLEPIVKSEYLPVLMYHHFEEEISDYPSMTITPNRFEEQLIALKEAGYEAINSEQALAFYQRNHAELPEKPVWITIDDGYFSNYEYAYPLIKKHGMHATIYVVAGHLGGNRLEIPHFTWDHAREMVASGSIDIQSHTYDMHTRPERGFESMVTLQPYNNLIETSDEHKTRILLDLLRSIDKIETELGTKVHSFAYPFELTTQPLKKWLKKLGSNSLF